MTSRKIKDLLRRIRDLALPYFFSEEKLGAWSLAILSAIGSVAFPSLIPQIGRLVGEMTSALAAGDEARLWTTVGRFFGLIGLLIVAGGLLLFSVNLLNLYWRRWLTRRFLREYLQSRVYYKLSYNSEIDNIDQRIAQDIDSFTSIISWTVVDLVSGPGFTIAGSIGLWDRSPTLVIGLWIYGIINVLIAFGVFAKVLSRLNFQQFKKEAAFRTSLVRVRENAEAIAFYQGEAKESAQVRHRFEQLYENQNRLIRWQNIYYYAFTDISTTIPAVLPFLILLPSVLSGNAEVGILVEGETNSWLVLSGFSGLYATLDSLAKLYASIDRLQALEAAIEDAGKIPVDASLIETREDDKLATSGLSLQTPNYQRTLFENLSFEVGKGRGLLVVGESGCGKSSLLRAIASLWQSGIGLIERPPLDKILFLSQRPYMVLGTLRNQLLYPYPNREVSAEQLHQALAAVNLADLPSQVGGFDVEIDWATYLSPGQQQRLSFARVLIAQPEYLVLDESTSALDIDNEKRLYQQIQAMNTTFISVAHRPTVVPYHSQVLKIKKDKTWEVIASENYQAQR